MVRSIEPKLFAQSVLTDSLPNPTQHRLRRRLSKRPLLAPYLLEARSPALSLGASAGNVNLRARHKGSSVMTIPRRRLRTKTPPTAVERVPSMGFVSRRMRSKGPPPQPTLKATIPPGSGGGLDPQPPRRGGPPAGAGQGSGECKHLEMAMTQEEMTGKSL